jgi:hypothetical protein
MIFINENREFITGALVTTNEFYKIAPDKNDLFDNIKISFSEIKENLEIL